LTLAVYQVTEGFPRQELHGLTLQLRRSASSVPADLEYHLLLAHDLKLIRTTEYSDLSTRVIEVKRTLTGLLQKLRADGR